MSDIILVLHGGLNMKVYTISGSMRFAEEMKRIARNLEATEGVCALQAVYNEDKVNQSLEELERIFACHYKKIDLCDTLYVVNIGGYIGEATKGEISYAKKKGKQIIYHEPIKK